eukprot:1146041-Pelagomonas_calceolata.AAC.5
MCTTAARYPEMLQALVCLLELGSRRCNSVDFGVAAVREALNTATRGAASPEPQAAVATRPFQYEDVGMEQMLGSGLKQRAASPAPQAAAALWPVHHAVLNAEELLRHDCSVRSCGACTASSCSALACPSCGFEC